MISLENIGKSFAKKKIFRGITVNYELGKRYGISGNNGSGKSTLLKIISGFTTPSEGEITYSFDSQFINADSIFSEISYAAPYIDLPQDLTFGDLLDFHFSMKKRAFHSTNEELNSYFNLPLDVILQNFSSGMLQRAKLSLAFFTKSKILILDEPTETLDEIGFELYASILNQFSANRIVLIASNKDRDFIDCESKLTISNYSI